MGPSDSGARGESVWADLRARRSQAGVTSGASTREASQAPPVLSREPIRSFEPGTIGRLVEDEVAATHDIAESMSRGMPAADPKKEAPFDAGPWDLVEIPPSPELPDYQRIK